MRQTTPDILGAVLSGNTAPTRLRVDNIYANGGTQMRAALDDGIIAEYAEAMLDGWGDFPPVVVFYDGERHWLADGFHRLAAQRQIDALAYIPADVRAGTRRDAVLHAAKANAAHGLRRTNADKRRAVTVLLEDEEWARWSDHEIARQCAVSVAFVGNLRRELTVNGLQSPDTRMGADGRTIDTTNIGKPRTVSPAPAQRPISNSEMAMINQGIEQDRQDRREQRSRMSKNREYYSAVDAARDKYEPAYQVNGPALPAWVEGEDAPWRVVIDASTDPAELGQALRGCVGSGWMERLWDGFMGEA